MSDDSLAALREEFDDVDATAEELADGALEEALNEVSE